MTARRVEVLLKHTESHSGEKDVKVLGVYATPTGVDDRVGRIAEANAQYPMRVLGPRWWVIGPEEDEGFFGHRLVFLERQDVLFHEEVEQ